MDVTFAFVTLTFYNTHGVIGCERVLEGAGIPVKITTAASGIDPDCTPCAVIRGDALDAALALLEKAGVKLKGVHGGG